MTDKAKRIPLTQGQFAIVDGEDYEMLMKYKWNAAKVPRGFIAVRTIFVDSCRRVNIRMHRQIMDAPKGMFVDHENHNTLDNQKHNLRVCTRSQNQWNKKPYRNKYKGVWYYKKENKWRASISKHGKSKIIGRYLTAEAAAIAYNKAAIELFGEFAYLNKVEG